MRKIELIKGNLTLKDKIEGFLERIVTPIGNSAKIDCPKRFMGRRAYLLICEDEHRRTGKDSKGRK
jgi:putative transposon-encoded protein